MNTSEDVVQLKLKRAGILKTFSFRGEGRGASSLSQVPSSSMKISVIYCAFTSIKVSHAADTQRGSLLVNNCMDV